MKLPDAITDRLPTSAIIDAQFILSDMRDIQRTGSETARDNGYDAASVQTDGQGDVPLGKRVE